MYRDEGLRGKELSPAMSVPNRIEFVFKNLQLFIIRSRRWSTVNDRRGVVRHTMSSKYNSSTSQHE